MHSLLNVKHLCRCVTIQKYVGVSLYRIMSVCHYIQLCHLDHHRQRTKCNLSTPIAVSVLKHGYSFFLYISLICFSLQHVMLNLRKWQNCFTWSYHLRKELFNFTTNQSYCCAGSAVFMQHDLWTYSNYLDMKA